MNMPRCDDDNDGSFHSSTQLIRSNSKGIKETLDDFDGDNILMIDADDVVWPLQIYTIVVIVLLHECVKRVGSFIQQKWSCCCSFSKLPS